MSDFLNDFPSIIANEFHAQGWKWRALSLIRDSQRLECLSQQLLNESTIDDGNDSNSNDNDDGNLLENSTKCALPSE